MTRKTIIVAYDAEKAIGRNGEIPWHHPRDLKHFRRETTGSTVLMGRKTWESLPEDSRPLENRKNIVLTRSGVEQDVEQASNLEEAWNKARGQVYICGGASVYRQTLDEADEMVITEVPGTHGGDTFFPEYNEENWKEARRETDKGLTFRWLERSCD